MKKIANRIISQAENRLISEVLDEFTLSLRVANRTAKTLKFYTTNLERFQWWLHEGDYPEHIDDIETSHIRLFLQYLQTNQHRWDSRGNHESNKPLRDASVHAYFRALRAFFAFAEREEFIEASPFTGRLTAPKVASRIAPHYTDGEVRAMLEACQRDDTDRLRDYSIILLLLDTGIRAEELCGLRLEDLQPERVKVLGKGNKERYLPLSAPTEKALRDYRRKERGAGGECLFLGRGTEGLSYEGLKSMIRRRGKQAGVNGARLHRFRHTFALNFIKNGGSLHALEALLGHTSPLMSMRYGAMVSQDAVDSHKAFSPVDRLLRGKKR